MNVASCDFERLYAEGGLYDASLLASRAIAKWIGTVDPGYDYSRELPARIVAGDAATASSVYAQYDAWNVQYRSGPSSELFALENALLYNRTLHVPGAGEWNAVYETHRPFERAFKIEELNDSLLGNVSRARNSDVSYFYLGSVGSENYAHWLIDDLTRARLLPALRQQGPVVLVLDKYGGHIDSVRHESFRALMGDNNDIDILFVHPGHPYLFERLFYVSPNTVHPFLKCPDALFDLHVRLRIASEGPKRLFVGRKALWRNLFNEAEIAELLVERGFTYVVIDQTPFREQVELFSNAEVIVGVSGASMGNTIFTPPGARLYYLAGEGFIDPFYWDLASILGHEHRVYFGKTWRPDMPAVSPFTMGEAQIRELLDDLAVSASAAGGR